MLPLPLFVLGVSLTEDVDRARATYDFAVLADRLHAAADFHLSLGFYRQAPKPNRLRSFVQG